MLVLRSCFATDHDGDDGDVICHGFYENHVVVVAAAVAGATRFERPGPVPFESRDFEGIPSAVLETTTQRTLRMLDESRQGTPHWLDIYSHACRRQVSKLHDQWLLSGKETHEIPYRISKKQFHEYTIGIHKMRTMCFCSLGLL